MKLFVDTSAFVALYNKRDQNHSSALNYYQKMVSKNTFVTTNFVMTETYTLLRARAGHSLAIRFGIAFRKSKIFEVIRVSEGNEEKAWKIFEKCSDKDFSFVDCASFVVMEQERIKTAFTFDNHFEQYGFSVKP